MCRHHRISMCVNLVLNVSFLFEMVIFEDVETLLSCARSLAVVLKTIHALTSSETPLMFAVASATLAVSTPLATHKITTNFYRYHGAPFHTVLFIIVKNLQPPRLPPLIPGHNDFS